MPVMIAPADDANSQDHFFELIRICWRQWRVERNLRGRGIDFRSTDPGRVRDAYSEMTPAEFAAINGRHAWANARTLRGSLAGLINDRPMTAIDLGSGSGTSTRLLARLMPSGSRILGVEFADALVEVARQQSYPSRDGSPQDVSFAAGSVADTFADAQGTSVATGGVDLVNASGILGHHLGEIDIHRALDEIHRVLAPGGIAALDVGPKLSTRHLAKFMQDRGFIGLRRTRGQLFDPTGQMVFRKRIR